MVRQPSVFLMDEPLSNLDAALRISMRAEIKELHKSMQTTFVYVTHDQAEALTLADRIVVIKDGVVQQIGTPDEIYERPKNLFVASFLGNPPINLLHGTIVPAYTINSLLGNIPILGEIFVGEKGSGVFAARYAIKGSLDDPTVTVDPLAALTPGFLRNIFSILDSGPAERKAREPNKKRQGKPAPETAEPNNTR